MLLRILGPVIGLFEPSNEIETDIQNDR